MESRSTLQDTELNTRDRVAWLTMTGAQVWHDDGDDPELDARHVSDLTPADVENGIRLLGQKANRKAVDYEQLAEAAARAEVAWKVARSKSLLQSTARSSDLREAEALDANEGLYLDHKVAEAVAQAALESLRTMRARLDAARSIGASVRATYTDGHA